MGRRKKADLIAEAQTILKDHQYKRLASWGEGGSGVWECSRSGSSCYAFTICITRMGIAVVGDVDGLSFNVGSSYGMQFLAGNDVSYYIHSKLEHNCKERELDQEALIFTVTERVMNHLFGQLDDEDVEIIERALGNRLPEMAFDSHEAAKLPGDCKGLVAALVAKHQKIEGLYGEELDLCPDWIREDHAERCLDLIEAAGRCCDVTEAYSLLNDFDLIQFDLCDVSIDRPSESLMLRLHLLNLAAKKILEQEKAAANPETCPVCKVVDQEPFGPDGHRRGADCPEAAKQ